MYDVYYTTGGGPWVNAGTDTWVNIWLEEIAPKLKVKPVLLIHRNKPRNFNEYDYKFPIETHWHGDDLRKFEKIVKDCRRINILHGHYKPMQVIIDNKKKIYSNTLHNSVDHILKNAVGSDSSFGHHPYIDSSWEVDVNTWAKKSIWIGLYDIKYENQNIPNFYEFKHNRPLSYSNNLGFAARSEGRKNPHFLDGKKAYFTSGDQGVASNGGLQLVSFPLYEEARPEKVVMMKGTLKDENGDPVKNGSISVTDKQTGEIRDGLVDKETGEYVVVLPVKDPKRPPVKPEKITITLNDEEVIADYGSKVQTINDKDVIVPPGGQIVLVNKKQEVLAKDEKVAEVNGTEKIIKKSDKIRQIDGVDYVVSIDNEVLDIGGEAVIVQKKATEKEKQRYVVSATGKGKAFSTAVLEVDPDSIDGSEKIYAKEAMQIETLAKNKPIRLNEVNFYTNSTIVLIKDILK